MREEERIRRRDKLSARGTGERSHLLPVPLLLSLLRTEDSMSTDHLEPRPVTRARSSTASSDFLLLTTEHESTPLLSPSPSSSIPLSPPRFRPLLQLAAVLDLVCVLGYGSTVPLTKLPLSAVSLNSLRPFVVIYAVTSVKVRENAPVLLGQLIASLSPSFLHMRKLHTLISPHVLAGLFPNPSLQAQRTSPNYLFHFSSPIPSPLPSLSFLKPHFNLVPNLFPLLPPTLHPLHSLRWDQEEEEPFHW